MYDLVDPRSSALVPYVQRAASQYATRGNPYTSMAKFAYNNRANIFRAAKFIGSRAKKRMSKFKQAKTKFSPKNLGEPMDTSTAKRVVTEDQAINRDTRTLYQGGLTEVIQGSSINQRERFTLNCLGFHICMEMKSLSTEPLYVNVAVLGLKDGTDAVSTTNFFRASDANRARDFDTSLTGMEFHCLPINTDKYIVLKHKRLRLVPGASPTTTVSLQGNSYANVDMWVPLRRQFRYDTTSNANPITGACYLVYWLDEFGAVTFGAAAASKLTLTRRAVMYYKEVCGC